MNDKFFSNLTAIDITFLWIVGGAFCGIMLVFIFRSLFGSPKIIFIKNIVQGAVFGAICAPFTSIVFLSAGFTFLIFLIVSSCGAWWRNNNSNIKKRLHIFLNKKVV